MPSLVVGLTGGIASGKSLAGDAFEKLGVPVCDADQVSRDIVQPGQPALAEIVNVFGDVLLDTGGLDRATLRKIVFNDESARVKLGKIMHPRIHDALRDWRDTRTEPYIVMMVPILVESGLVTLVDRVLLIDVESDIQLQRLVARDEIDTKLAKSMMASQMPATDRPGMADDILLNDGTPDELRGAVAKFDWFYRSIVDGRTQADQTMKVSAAGDAETEPATK